MKFNELYPIPKVTTIGPHPDYYPDKEKYPAIHYSRGHYECFICKCLTGWRDDDFNMVCSEECYQKLLRLGVDKPEDHAV